MPTEVEVVQDALMMIGEQRVTASSTTLASIDNSAAGRVVKQTFDRIRDRVNRDHPWNFALRRGRIHPDVQPPPYGFARRYKLADFDKDFFLADADLLENTVRTSDFLGNIHSHYYKNAQGPYRLEAVGGALPTGLNNATDYYVELIAIALGITISQQSTTLRFTTQPGKPTTVVDITVDGTGGPHIIKPFPDLTIFRVWEVDGEAPGSEWKQEGGYVLTDLGPPFFCTVIYKQTDLNQWDANAIRALTKALAMEWAITIANNIQLSKVKEEEYQGELSDARSIDGQEEFPTDESASLSSWIRAR